MLRMRTLTEAIEELREIDPRTAVTMHFLRELVKSGKIPCIYAGRKYLLNMDALEAYLSCLSTNTQLERDTEPSTYGIRPIAR